MARLALEQLPRPGDGFLDRLGNHDPDARRFGGIVQRQRCLPILADNVDEGLCLTSEDQPSRAAR